ncbi:hypothetical protein SAY87_016614 [Trapa incisa]|uniref:Uncharacterized protein n=1 Tax=Trapa incisa TaxID=236973 RepID=A0AAN7L1I8_9MYRT|nr:hypothetical protein SAY87_016614 [Trapa incisa]
MKGTLSPSSQEATFWGQSPQPYFSVAVSCSSAGKPSKKPRLDRAFHDSAIVQTRLQFLSIRGRIVPLLLDLWGRRLPDGTGLGFSEAMDSGVLHLFREGV